LAQKHFNFDDEDVKIKKPSGHKASMNETQEFHFKDEDDVVSAKKPSGKRKLKKWPIVLGIFVLLIVIGIVSVYNMTKEDGPVYGDRCAGLLPITQNIKTTAIEAVKKDHNSVKSIHIETACRTVKIDIVYVGGTSARVAESIAQDAAKKLDAASGRPKATNSAFSDLFGTYNNEKQYEINFYLTAEDNASEYPIYGTKKAGSDNFNFTLASVRDQATYNKVNKK